MSGKEKASKRIKYGDDEKNLQYVINRKRR